MTEERFNEIRKRKYAEDRVVYTVFAGDKKATALNIVNDDEWFMAITLFNEIYETKEEAEWYCKMNKSRIEKFEPPMWKDIENRYEFWFYNKSKLYHFIVDRRYTGCIEINTAGVGIFGVYGSDVTQKNYKKACEMVGKLFEGGKE